MKTLLTLLIASSGLLACKKESPIDKGIAPGQPFELAYKQTTTLATSTSTSAQLTLTNLVDSRCPINAYCIWAGVAEVTLTLTDAANTQTVRLGVMRNAQTPDSVAVTLNEQAYWLRLLSVTPYPGDKGGQSPVAVLRLRAR